MNGHGRSEINICPPCFVTLIAFTLSLRAGINHAGSFATRDESEMILIKLNIAEGRFGYTLSRHTILVSRIRMTPRKMTNSAHREGV